MTVGSKIGDVSGILALFLEVSERLGRGSPAIAAFTEVMKQRMPNKFGFGWEDERLFETIRQLLTPPPKRDLIDLVIGNMKDYEENIFRITVTGMPCGSELNDDPVKNPVKGAPTTTKKVVSWEFTEKDLRVKYLVDIADEVAHRATSSDNNTAAKEVVEAMRARRLITRSPSAQKAYELWIETTKWAKMEILDLFGVDSFNRITWDMVAEKINLVASKIPERKNLNPGWWRWMFQNHLIATIVVIIVIAVAIAASLTPPPIH